MSRCLKNGLNYPFYYITVWDWIKDSKKENGGEYEPFTFLETEDYDEAYKALENIKLSADRLQATLFLDTEEDIEWVAAKDEWNGIYNE